MSHGRCVRSCYFALFLPSVFLSVLFSPVFRRSVQFCFLRYSAVSVQFCSLRYSADSFPSAVSCSVPCGIPQAITLLLQSPSLAPYLRHTYATCAIFLSCSLRYSAGNYPSHSITLKHAGSFFVFILFLGLSELKCPSLERESCIFTSFYLIYCF